MESFKSKAYGASGSMISGKKLEPMEVERQEPQGHEVLVDVLYCGVCHSDIHQVENDWKNTIYPCVPGHEIIGRISRLGQHVEGYKVGDVVGIGCMIDSCQHCKSCNTGEEQYCLGPVAMTMTYNGYFKPKDSDFNTFGGFSTHIVCNAKFLLRIPPQMNLAAAAPILCAGVTTYSPLKRWKIKNADKVAIVGIGGLGHMAVMIAKAMGAHVTAITTHEEKRKDALKLGADEVIVSTDEKAMESKEITYDYILCTIPDSFDVNPYIALLKPHGSLVTVGLLAQYKSATDNMEVAKLNRTVGGSLIGSIAETQEIIDFCAEHDILPEIEMINIKDINDAFKKIKEEEVRFRYVIDMKSLNE